MTHQADAAAEPPLAGTEPASDQPSGDTALWSVWVAAALCAVGFLWVRASQLFVGLRTDESLSVWVSSDSLGEAISRAQRFQGNSPIYFSFLWLWRQIVGDGEFMMRLPSLLAVVATCLVAVRFGRELGSTHMGMAAAAALLTGPGVIVASTATRPYAFLLLFALISSRALWHWLTGPGESRHAIVWVVAFALAVAMSPFAATLGLAHAAALIDHRLRDRALPQGLWRYVALAIALTLPLAPQVLEFFLNRESFVLTDPPSMLAVLGVLLPAAALVVVALSAPGTAFTGLTSNHRDAPELLRFFLAWSMLPILALYVAGLVAGSPVFIERYRLVAVIGGALLVGLIVRNLPPLNRHIAVIGLALFSVWSMAGADSGDRDGWREAFAWAESQTDETDDRILALNPSLIETLDFDVLDDPEWTDYLGAHADAYGFDAPRLIVPRVDPSAELLDRRVAELFSHEVVVVVDTTEPTRWVDALSAAADDADYATTIGPEDGDIAVAVFTRNAS